MQRMMSTKEAASLWNISDRQVSKLCVEGKIKGAVKKGRTWAIPVGTENRQTEELSRHRPSDSRIFRCPSVFPITVWHQPNTIMLTRP